MIAVPFITNDGKKRVLISETQNYQAVVELTQLDKRNLHIKEWGKMQKERCRSIC